MKNIPSLTGIFLFSCWLIAGCSNANSKEKIIVADKNAEDGISTKPTVSVKIDGRLIESSDFSCSWVLIGKLNVFNLTVHYDREPKKTPPDVGFNIKNLKDIKQPFSPVYGKNIAGTKEQISSLSMSIPKGKAHDMNEQSYSDNYAGLASSIQLSLLDTAGKIVSGRFEGTVKNANGKSIKITQGKFERIPLKMQYSYKFN